MEAINRIQGKPVVQMSHSVAKLWVHSPGTVNIVVEEGAEEDALAAAEAAVQGDVRRTMLTQFLDKCAHPETREEIARRGLVDGPLANELRYEDFPRYYRWVSTTPKRWERRKRDVPEENFIARLGSVNPRNAELTALRILLQNTAGKLFFQTPPLNANHMPMPLIQVPPAGTT